MQEKNHLLYNEFVTSILPKFNFRRVGFLILFLILLSLIYIFGFIRPSNNRNWETGYEKIPKITLTGDQVSIQDLRDYHTFDGQTFFLGYVNRSVDISKLNQVWFIVEPFGDIPGSAHTYFVFDFAGQDPLAISIEARREKGEKFNILSGTFNSYELIYVWSSEQDATIRRVFSQHNKLYMYPLKITQNGAQRLFLQLVQSTQELEQHPRFYNTFTSNCTNELAKSANKVKPNAIPLDIAYLMPGYSPQLLYRLGYLPQDRPLTELTKKSYLNEIVKKIFNQPDFSHQLRVALQST